MWFNEYLVPLLYYVIQYVTNDWGEGPEINMKDSLKMANLKVMELKSLQMEINMKESFKMTKVKEKEFKSMQMELNMKEIIKMVKKKAMEFFS